jgi:agmatine deiminase
MSRAKAARRAPKPRRRVAARIPSGPTPFAQGYRMPAEWEPHEATWLAWPHEASDWPGKFALIPWVFVELTRLLTRSERVRMIVGGAREKAHAKAMLKSSGVDLGRVDFVTARTDRSWTRDFVPTFVVRSGRATAAAPRVAAVGWRFDGWKRYPNHEHDARAGQLASRHAGAPRFEPVVTLGERRHHVVLEGGAIDVDGEGTLLATEECLLDGKQARNPELGRALTEQVLRDFLGVDKVLWLGRGIAGDDTGGHIDDFARFVAPGRVVLAEERNRRDPNQRVLAEAFERLRGARDARGRRLEIVRLPMPEPIVFEKQRLPASYANFYVASHSVLVPTFADPQDRVALGVFAELFPEREVIGVPARDLVLGLGTLHCSTQQEPR